MAKILLSLSAGMKNYYQTLGIEPDASFDDIRKAYRRSTIKFHADKQNGTKPLESRLKDIQEACEVLSSETSRDDYDEILFTFYSSREDEPDVVDENLLRKAFEAKSKHTAADFKKPEPKITEGPDVKHQPLTSKAEADQGSDFTLNAGSDAKPLTEGSNTPFTIFWVIHCLIISALCIIAIPPALYPLSYWFFSFVIIQKGLGLRWMVLNFALYWIVIPTLALFLFEFWR